MTAQLIQAALFSSVIAAWVYWRGSLARSGALAALLVGTLTVGCWGWLGVGHLGGMAAA